MEERHDQPNWSKFNEISTSSDWFKVYQVKPNLIVIHEPRHYEATSINLVIGEDKALLIDTGCGIGDLGKLVREITDKPIWVINTHTHTDHIAGNHHFVEILMFDHLKCHNRSENGIDFQQHQDEILNENLITPPLPKDFETSELNFPPFHVKRWLKEGDLIDLGNQNLEVIYTPGEAEDHICLLDRVNRILFSGDILLHGPVWAHLEGSNVFDLIESYKKLMGYYEEFDYIMPSHNEPFLSKDLLPNSLMGAERVALGEAEYKIVKDLWGREIKEYDFSRFSIWTQM